MEWKQRPVKKRTRTPTKIDLTVDFVRSILDYDPESGILTWKYRKDLTPGWNTRFVGTEAGNINNLGYRQIAINRSRYQAHRLAWLIVTGEWPQHQIDHEDGNPSNNRFSNLREATDQENNQNRKTPSNNTSGVKGVYWDKHAQKWRAWIVVDRKRIHLGLFDSFDEAVAVRQAAEIRYFGGFVRQAA
jgi:hypothetical protein